MTFGRLPVLSEIPHLSSNLCTNIQQSKIQNLVPTISSYTEDVIRAICSHLPQTGYTSTVTLLEELDSDANEVHTVLQNSKIHDLNVHSCSLSKKAKVSAQDIEYFLKYFQFLPVPNFDSEQQNSDISSVIFDEFVSQLDPVPIPDDLNSMYVEPNLHFNEIFFPTLQLGIISGTLEGVHSKYDMLSLIQAVLPPCLSIRLAAFSAKRKTKEAILSAMRPCARSCLHRLTRRLAPAAVFCCLGQRTATQLLPRHQDACHALLGGKRAHLPLLAI